MKSFDLIPCPFCGGRAEIKDERVCYGHGDYAIESFVCCSDCNASAGSFSSWEFPDDGTRRLKAVSSWNYRGWGA